MENGEKKQEKKKDEKVNKNKPSLYELAVWKHVDQYMMSYDEDGNEIID